MVRLPYAAGCLLVVAALACNLPALSPVRRLTPTPRSGGLTPSPGGTAFPVPPTETPLGVFGPTHTPGLVLPTETALRGAVSSPGTPTMTPTGTPTPTPTPTETETAGPSKTPTLGPLTITNVSVVAVRRDASQPNGAVATVQVFFTGGRGPFSFFDEGQSKPGNPYEVVTTCGASLVHTATVTSQDGQTASQPYFAKVDCPG
jgi:hypothetical protein